MWNSTAPFPEWFYSIKWYYQYFILVGIIYSPAIVLTWIGGTLIKCEKTQCDISFIFDFTFHIIWLLAIPLFFVLVKWFYSEANAAFESLANTTPAIVSEQLKTRIVSFHRSPIPVTIGCIVGVLSAGTIAFLNLRSLRVGIEVGKTTWSWWLPSGQFCPATVFFFVICGLVTCGGLIVITRYVHGILSIREAVLLLSLIHI